MAFQISSKDVGRLIGRGGATIRELRQKSGARIDIGEEGDFDTDVHLRGTEDQMREAEKMVNAELGYVEPTVVEKGSGANDDDIEPIDWAKLKIESDRAQKEKWAKCPKLIKDFYKQHPEVSPLSYVSIVYILLWYSPH